MPVGDKEPRLDLTMTFPRMDWSGRGSFKNQLPHSFNIGPGKWVNVLDTGVVILPAECLIKVYRIQKDNDFPVAEIRADSIEKVLPGGKVVIDLGDGILTVRWHEQVPT